jgi:hypothetical protein
VQSKRAKHLGAVVVIMLVAAWPTTSSAEVSEVTQDGPGIASFEGQRINLADGWGKAKACATDGITTTCYRSEAAMDAAVAKASGGELVQASTFNCSSPLKLYRGTSFTGAVMQISGQFQFLSLASMGFDNDTSSYKVGACGSYLYDGYPNVSLYPGNTTALWSQSAMLTGWDNRISSVYIN